MLLQTDSVLEVNRLAKLYSRTEASTRKRVARAFARILFGLTPKPAAELLPGEFWGLKDIGFSLKRGEALGVIGFNGAGKTTLLRILAGQILPDAGDVRIMGNTAAMIDLTAGFNATASGRQNVFLRGAMLGRSNEEMQNSLQEIIAFSELGDAIDAPFGTYSSGMRMRLAFSIMIVSEPDILFIDEILSVGDFRFQQKCLAKIREIRERVAFVLVSHSIANVKLFCSKVLVLHEGEMAFLGDPEEAISIYEEMRFPTKSSLGEKHTEILKPQFHNEDRLTDIQHFWCDKSGAPIAETRTGKPLYLHVSFKLDFKPRNLIIGVPVWTSEGVYVTGFSTPRAAHGLDVMPNKTVRLVMEVPDLAFNPGDYISNIAIHDGPEFLYRGENPVLSVLTDKHDSWGVVSLQHNWKVIQQ